MRSDGCNTIYFKMILHKGVPKTCLDKFCDFLEQGSRHMGFIGYHPFFFGILEIINSSRGSKRTGRSREGQEKGVVRRGMRNVRPAELGGFHRGVECRRVSSFKQRCTWK